MEGVLARMKGLDQGRLKITVVSTANYFAPQLLANFCQRHPEVTVNLDVTNREVLLQQLANNETDLAIMGQPPEGQDLGAESFMENPLVVIASPSHALAGDKHIAVATTGGGDISRARSRLGYAQRHGAVLSGARHRL